MNIKECAVQQDMMAVSLKLLQLDADGVEFSKITITPIVGPSDPRIYGYEMVVYDVPDRLLP